MPRDAAVVRGKFRVEQELRYSFRVAKLNDGGNQVERSPKELINILICSI